MKKGSIKKYPAEIISFRTPNTRGKGMLLDTNNHSSRKKEKKVLVTDINPACGNLHKKVMGKGTCNIYLPYNAERSTNQTIFPAAVQENVEHSVTLGFFVYHSMNAFTFVLREVHA